MIVPSIDVMGGQTVQLRGGKEMVLEAGDPLVFARRFDVVGETAVVDLDAAMRQGNNTDLIKSLLPVARCRVGGGIRDVETAKMWLDAGAVKIVLGTAAVPDILCQLPRERLVAALDAVHGEVVVDGWREKTGRNVFDRMVELRDLVGGFLVTFVEREGRMSGVDLKQIKELVEAAAPARLTVAGGVTTAEEVAAIDRLGADAQVGMALYTGRMQLADCVAALLHTPHSEGVWPTVVVDEVGVALGLVYSDLQSLRAALDSGRGVYHSRKRGLWRKGETSGNHQELLRIDLDCDRDTLRFTVRQFGSGFCHLETRTCWGEDGGAPALLRKLRSRLESAPPGSYTKRLLDDPALLAAKLVEEAQELADADNVENATWETADLLYFALVAMVRRGVELDDVWRELDRRALGVQRRRGDAKPGALAAQQAAMKEKSP